METKEVFDIDEFMKNGKPVDMSVEGINKKLKEELEKRSKKKEDLIVPLNFNIEEITYGMRTLTSDNGVMGTGYRSSKTGIIPHVVMKGHPHNDSGITEIEFNGFCILEKGDKIKTYIEKYDVQKIRRNSGLIVGGKYPEDEFYIPREFNNREVVHKIEKLGGKNLDEVLATFEC